VTAFKQGAKNKKCLDVFEFVMYNYVVKEYKIKFLPILFIVISLNSCLEQKNAANKKGSVAEKTNRDIELLSEKYGYDFIFSSEARETRGTLSTWFYRIALDLYNKNDFLGAISKVEEALSLYIYAPYYYLYGLCYMEIQNYENAEKAFNKALDFMDYEIENAKMGYLAAKYQGISMDYTEISQLYTYDENDNSREKYFALYNLACIYSIKMELEKSSELLIEAIKNGYPYINHLLADSDLINLFESNSNIKPEIVSVYQNGFINDFSGKIYEYRLDDTVRYYFIDDSNIEIYYPTADFQSYFRYGIYEIKNYLLLIHFTKETGRRGYGVTTGYMTYENYEEFENDINGKLIISVVDVKSGGREWEEVKAK
jgi:tetratricopeptide (TPR) repeat protein